jgi:hypothetical protein
MQVGAELSRFSASAHAHVRLQLHSYCLQPPGTIIEFTWQLIVR